MKIITSRRGSIGLILFLFFTLSRGACADETGSNWLLRNYSKNNGLSQNTITAIAEDKQGVIWVGTQFGVHKFDGYEFTAFNRNHLRQGKGLLNDHAHDLAVDGNGRLWAGTDKGLYFYSPEKNNFVLFGAESYFHPVESLAVDEQGKLWLGGHDGLYRVLESQGQIQKVAFDERRVTALQSFEHSLYMVTDGVELQSYNLTNGAFTTHFGGTTNQLIVDIEVLDVENILAATTSGLTHITSEGSHPVFPEQVENANVIVLGENTKIWVGTSSGLFLLEGVLTETPEYTRINTNIPLTQVMSVHLDAHQLMWIGTLNDGLFLHNLTSDWITSLSSDPTSKFATLGKSITALALDQKNRLWQGSSQGTAVLNWEQNQAINYPLGAAHSAIRRPLSVMFTDSFGVVWAGYRNGPLARYDKAQDRFLSVTPNLKVLITSINELSNEQLLFTTRDRGFFIFNKDDHQLRQFSKQSFIGYELATDRLQSNFMSERGQVWIGSFDAGLYLYDIATHRVIKHYSQDNTAQAIAGNLIVSIYQSNDFELWVGTASGLSYINLNHDEVINYGDKHKGAGQTIYGISQDLLGRIWMSTNQGMLMYDQTSLQFRQFNQEDGLPNEEFNSNALVFSKGFLYAGGVKGLARIDTTNVPPIGKPPSTLLTDFYLAGKVTRAQSPGSPLTQALDSSKELKLNYQQNGFSVGFTAVNYQVPLKVKFRYKLVPLDTDWLEGDYKRRLATYTNLDAGEYQFSVASSLNGVDWGPVRNLNVTIAPAPWRSDGAIALYTIASLLLTIILMGLWRRKRQFEIDTLSKIRKKEQDLTLALWGSGDEFWNYDIAKGMIYRQNPLEDAAYGEVQSDKEFEAFIHPKDLSWVASSLASCIKGESETFELAFRLKCAHGGWFWVLSKGKVSEKQDGKTRLISGANKNIDSLKLAQEALRKANDELEDKVNERTKELKKANRDITIAMDELQSTQEQLVAAEKMASLGNMVAGIAHEINTPLGVAITSLSHAEQSAIEVVRDMEQQKLTANKFNAFTIELKNGLQMAHRNLHRAAELVNSFKQVSVDQSSELIRQFELHQLLTDTVNTIRPKFKRTNIEISVDCPVNIQMNSYPGALSQVLMNLMMNSYTHGFKQKKQGEILIDTKWDGDTIILTYKDSGSGIDKENQLLVFEPFYTTNRSKGNTGLGLHICYNLITQKLKGEIALNSDLGSGVEFTIRLPLTVNATSHDKVTAN